MPALLRAKIDASDEISITKVTTIKEGYMSITEFEHLLGAATVKVFPSKSAALSYTPSEKIVKVKLEREL